MFETFSLVKASKPSLFFVQNPSMVLAFFAVSIIKPIFRVPIIVDRHSNFLLTPQKRCWGKEWLFNFMSFFTIRYADLTIVTNAELAHVIVVQGGNAFVLPDKIPDIGKSIPKPVDDQRKKLFVISSFAQDEPIEEIVEALKQYELFHISVFISGNYNKRPGIKEGTPNNLFLTGFISDEDFIDHLNTADAIMVLTNIEYTLLCGCYEAVAAEKPLITSDTVVLRKLFFGSKFVDCTPESIGSGIQSVFENLADYKSQTSRMKTEMSRNWNRSFAELLEVLNKL
jgi:glycosyltransferase involved in cell wall biosynthesis